MPPRLSLVLSFTYSLFSLALAQSLTPTDLVDGLLPTSTNLSAVYGERINLRPYALTFLANETHAQATLNISSGVDDIGWVALGLGTDMADAAMLIMWPSSEDSSTWVLSHRSAGGHATPDFNPSITSSTPGRWELVPSLTASSSSAKTSTIVTISRTLDLPDDQGVWPTSRIKYANLARKKNQKIIYAASETRPGLDTQGAALTMHTGKNFGATSLDLSESFLRVESTEESEASGTATSAAAEASSTGASGSVTVSEVNEADEGKVVSSPWTQYDYLIAAHAVFAMLTWLLISPAAVLLARLGRKWASWFTWHSSIQTYLTSAFTVIVVALGIAAASKHGTSGSIDAHKTMGLLVLVILVFQLAMGYLAHSAPFTASRGSTRPSVRVVHIVAGILLLICAWITIGLGFREWKTRQVGVGVKAVYWLGIALFLLPFLYSLFTLIRLRHREGRSILNATFGLGRTSAIPPAYLGRAWDAGLPPTPTGGVGDMQQQVQVKVAKEDWGKTVGGDLSAWSR
ncbi:hypothetical protein JCM11641_008176 [Rhodosporidiobolus odoratus]